MAASFAQNRARDVEIKGFAPNPATKCHPVNGQHWEEETSHYLDDNGQPEDDDAKRSIALMEEGHDQLLDFLTKVWGVGPVSEDEVRGWKVEMRAQDEALESLVRVMWN